MDDKSFENEEFEDLEKNMLNTRLILSGMKNKFRSNSTCQNELRSKRLVSSVSGPLLSIPDT